MTNSMDGEGMKMFEKFKEDFDGKTVLITGGAGFIGSNLARRLVQLGANVRVIDNLITGHKKNIEDLIGNGLEFIEGDIRDFDTCAKAMMGVHYISHQAALGSVPRSIDQPLASHDHNVNGTVNILCAAVNANIPRVVMASSSSVYGTEETLPKIEHRTGKLLSPYAATKSIGEIYGQTMNEVYGIDVVAMRYFNIFGPRQDPEGPYAAVIPKFIEILKNGDSPLIFGDGLQSRDFTYVDNAVFANLSAMAKEGPVGFTCINIACGDRLTVIELVEYLKQSLAKYDPSVADIPPKLGKKRPGDILHSHADIKKAGELFDYRVLVDAQEGIQKTVDWFIKQSTSQ
jgi:UDP-N-acetylglucosamine 4-epimerase